MTPRGPDSQFTMPAKDAGFKTVDEQAGYIPDHVDLRRARTITVPLSEISVATQPQLNPDLVSQYAASAPKRKPLLRSWGDGIAVLNGHHTIAAARQRHEKDIRARWMPDDDGW
jgi:hypothetical protein